MLTYIFEKKIQKDRYLKLSLKLNFNPLNYKKSILHPYQMIKFSEQKISKFVVDSK